MHTLTGGAHLPLIVGTMSEEDRRHWDSRHAEKGMAPVGDTPPPPVFAPYEDLFPTEGHALDIACGRGRGAVWLASRGMLVHGVDVSPVAIDLARRLASLNGVSDRCRFEVFDLEHGLPEGPPVDLLFCHLFRHPPLYRPMMDRLKPGGLLAIGVLSEVDAGPGRYRTGPGELLDTFGELEVLVHGEGEGMAWIVARRAR